MSNFRIFCFGAVGGQITWTIWARIEDIEPLAYFLMLPIVWMAAGIVAVAILGRRDA